MPPTFDEMRERLRREEEAAWRGRHGLTVDDVAERRSERNRHSRTHRGILGDPRRIDREGVVGEAVVAARFGIEEQVHADHPTAYNLVLTDGTRLDVCASSHYRPNLLVTPQEARRRTVDAYVLVEVDTKRGSGIIRGWATREEVRAAPLRQMRADADPVHALPIATLRPIEELEDRHRPHTLSLFG